MVTSELILPLGTLLTIKRIILRRVPFFKLKLLLIRALTYGFEPSSSCSACRTFPVRGKIFKLCTRWDPLCWITFSWIVNIDAVWAPVTFHDLILAQDERNSIGGLDGARRWGWGIWHLVAGLITGIVSLCFHLFWKFKTAQTERSRWKALSCITWRKMQREHIAKRPLISRASLVQKTRRPLTAICSMRNQRRRPYKHYQRHAA